MTVWGEDYIDQFINISLPTVLANGNLEGFNYLDGSKFLIFTTQDGRERLLDEPLFGHLQKLITVDFVLMDALIKSRKFDTVNMCQLEGVMRSMDFDALFFIYPDFVWAAGSFNNVADRLVEGYKGFICPVPRLSTESFSPAFNTLKFRSETGAVNMESREFVAICEQNLHPMMDTYEVQSENFSFFPSNLSWKIPNAGRLYHCYHSHPIALRIDANNINLFYRFSVSLDEDYMSTLFSSADCLYVAKDSDEIAVCSLTPDEFNIVSSRRFEKDQIHQLWIWAERYASIFQRSMIRHPYRWHFNDIKDEEWRGAEQKADGVIDIISERLSLPDTHVKYADSMAYEGRRFRHKMLKKRRLFGSLVRYLFEPNDIEKLNFAHLRMRLYFITLTRLTYLATRIFNAVPFLFSIYIKIRQTFIPRDLFGKFAKNRPAIQVPFYVELYNYVGKKLRRGRKK